MDWQEEVATLNGVNIPLAAYRYETGAAAAPSVIPAQSVIWRDRARHWKATRANPAAAVRLPATQVRDAYWRLSDPLPALFHALTMFMRTLRRALRRRETRRSGKVLSVSTH